MIGDWPYVLSHREQQQLFLFDWDYVRDVLFEPGGAAALIGRFLVQFFYSPAAAVAITLLCLLGMICIHRKQFPLILVPVFFLMASLADFQLHFDIVPACLLASGGFVLWCRSKRKHLAGIAIPVMLFFLAGSAAFLFGMCALAYGLGKATRETLKPAAVPLISALLTGGIALRMNLVPELGYAFSPRFYYDISSGMPGFHLFFWFLFPAAVLLSAAVERLPNRKLSLGVSSALVLAALPFAFTLFTRQGKDGAFNLYKYEYYAVRGRWEELERISRKRIEYPQTANWYYLAKSYRGTLARDLMKQRHNREYDLLFVPEGTGASTSAIPHVLLRMGCIAAAQNVAYNLMFATCGYNPTLLKMQADIELMRGNYKVAGKYIGLLEKSFSYREWARERRRFLDNDALVEEDPVLGRGRRAFPAVQAFSTPLYPMHAIYAALRTNPSDKVAMEYGLSYLLLAKDIVNVANFIEEFYGTPGLEELPVCAQEALCFFSDYQQNLAREKEYSHMDMDWCLAHGISQQTVTRMHAFQEASLKTGGKAPQGSRGTYWYYLLYDDMVFNDSSAATEDKAGIY